MLEVYFNNKLQQLQLQQPIYWSEVRAADQRQNRECAVPNEGLIPWCCEKQRGLKCIVNSNGGFFCALLIPDYNVTLSFFFSPLQHKVVTVPGDHHVHLNNPEVIAPLVSDFLQSQVLLHLVLKEGPKL